MEKDWDYWFKVNRFCIRKGAPKKIAMLLTMSDAEFAARRSCREWWQKMALVASGKMIECDDTMFREVTE